MKEFSTKIQRAVQKKLGQDYEVRLQSVSKNNSITLQGLMIMKAGQNIFPTIYLEAFYAMYQSGETLENVVEKLLTVYESGAPKHKTDMEFFRCFEKVKKRIAYRLVNAKANEKLLQDIPHLCFLDLAICFFYAYHDEELGDGMITIRDSHVEMWQTTTLELFQLAQKNTPGIFPAEFLNLDDVIKESEPEEWMQESSIRESASMYILTNRKRSQGAASLLYPGILEKIAGKLNGDFYLLPSSVHEIVVLKDTRQETPSLLRSMIQEVNDTLVEPEEILSYHLYYYHVSDKKITIVSE